MMQFSNLLPLLLALIATTTARPSSQPTLVEKDDWPSFPWHDLFYLKTKVINGGNESMDGLYVYAYRTGAGLSDAALGYRGQAALGFFNDTIMQLYTTLQDDGVVGGLTAFFLPQATTHDAWYPVRLNAGMSTDQMSLDNTTGFQWTASEGFDGWLACDWSHGVPQLFWKYDFYNYPMPVCTPVELYPEYIDDKLGKGTWVADSEALS